MSLVVQCEFSVRGDSEAEFLRVARALAAAAATEPGTLRYQWFVMQKPARYSILEEYVDADAAEAHNNHVASLLRELFAVANLESASFYGELNEYLRNWASGRAGITVNAPL
jgi:quinol monooxygenase YgiN